MKEIQLLHLLRHRQPALLTFGQFISGVGDGVSNIVLVLLVISVSHSTADVALFGAARTVPLVAFLLFGGVVVDRFSRRTLTLISDLGRGFVVGAIATMAALGRVLISELLVAGALFGTFDAVFMPAIAALIPEITPRELLGPMNAMRSLSMSVAPSLLGPALGGILASVSTSFALYFDAGTFAVSAICLVAIGSTPRPHSSPHSMMKDIGQGINYVRGTNWLWSAMLAVMAMNAFVFSPAPILITYLMRHDLHTSKQIVGYVFATFGLSGALGALIMSQLPIPVRRVRAMWLMWAFTCLSATIIGVATHVWVVVVYGLISGPGLVGGQIIWNSLMQSEVPTAMMGRANAVDQFFSSALGPIGIIVAGIISAHTGVRPYFLCASLICVLPAFLIIFSRRLNSVDQARVALARGM